MCKARGMVLSLSPSLSLCVCVCVCVCPRAGVCTCLCVCLHRYIYLCTCRHLHTRICWPGGRPLYGIPGIVHVLKSTDFGQNWSWIVMPPHLQKAAVLAVDPTSPTSLYAVAPNCLASSGDGGASWSKCSTADGIRGSNLVSLHIKNSQVINSLPLIKL